MSEIYRCAVVGNPIAHSLSPVIHQQFAKQFAIKLDYQKLLASDDDFISCVGDFFASGGLGLNITSPFKKRAFALADSHREAAELTGCANTLWQQDGKLIADSTDGHGFKQALTNFGDCQKKRWLILGAGDVVACLLAVIDSLQPKAVTIANRHIEKAKAYQHMYPAVNVCELSHITSQPDIIINATSIDFNESWSAAIGPLCVNSACMDLNYGHQPTSFMVTAKAQGAREAIDGFDMLVHQGAQSFYRWFAKQPCIKSSLISREL